MTTDQTSRNQSTGPSGTDRTEPRQAASGSPDNAGGTDNTAATDGTGATGSIGGTSGRGGVGHTGHTGYTGRVGRTLRGALVVIALLPLLAALILNAQCDFNPFGSWINPVVLVVTAVGVAVAWGVTGKRQD